jgi:hypothetical protein
VLERVNWKRKIWVPNEEPPELGTRETLVNWVRDEEEIGSPLEPLIDMVRYAELLKLLPDKIVENLEKARLSRDGRMPMIRAGLGYAELLSAVIVDGSAIASSSTEAFLFPALKFGENYLAPGGIPGRTLRFTARGRQTTLTTAGTQIFKIGAALTNVIPTTTWAISGAVIMDAVAAQTATMWYLVAEASVRAVGSAGTIFAMGDSDSAATKIGTAAERALRFMCSAGGATPATAAVDTTVAQYVSLTGKWSLSTAYSMQGHNFCVESLN